MKKELEMGSVLFLLLSLNFKIGIEYGMRMEYLAFIIPAALLYFFYLRCADYLKETAFISSGVAILLVNMATSITVNLGLPLEILFATLTGIIVFWECAMFMEIKEKPTDSFSVLLLVLSIMVIVMSGLFYRSRSTIGVSLGLIQGLNLSEICICLTIYYFALLFKENRTNAEKFKMAMLYLGVNTLGLCWCNEAPALVLIIIIYLIFSFVGFGKDHHYFLLNMCLILSAVLITIIGIPLLQIHRTSNVPTIMVSLSSMAQAAIYRWNLFLNGNLLWSNRIIPSTLNVWDMSILSVVDNLGWGYAAVVIVSYIYQLIYGMKMLNQENSDSLLLKYGIVFYLFIRAALAVLSSLGLIPYICFYTPLLTPCLLLIIHSVMQLLVLTFGMHPDMEIRTKTGYLMDGEDMHKMVLITSFFALAAVLLCIMLLNQQR